MAHKAELTQEQFEGLHKAVDKVKRGTKVTVDKAALSALLSDYSQNLKEPT